MCFGHPLEQRVQINDSTAWSGSPRSEQAGGVIEATSAANALRRARDAIDDGRFDDATSALTELQHRYTQSYLPFVDLFVNIRTAHVVTDYERYLALDTATHTVNFRLGGRSVSGIVYASRPHGVLVYELKSDVAIDIELNLSSKLRVAGTHSREAVEGGGADPYCELALTLQLPSDVAPAHEAVSPPIVYDPAPGAAMRASAVLGWRHDGVETGAGSARGVHTATIMLATETTFRGIGIPPGDDVCEALTRARERVRIALTAGAEVIRAAQLDDHRRLYARAHLQTGRKRERSAPIDERLSMANRTKGGAVIGDPQLAGLLFNFGRYLLICSSRPGGVPANLQGIWNDSLRPPWSSAYTTNINLQMNYWPANVANLAECLPPLYDLIDGLAAHGRETAQRLYAASGWVAHHNTDVWAYTHPVGLGRHDPKWAFWPMAGLWLVQHLTEALDFGADDNFARSRVWLPLRGAAEFALSWLVEQPDGRWATNPATSPENVFSFDGHRTAAVAAASALDQMLIADTLDSLVEVASRLGMTDDPIVHRAELVRKRLNRPGVGRNGLIAEWADDFFMPDPTHRHLSPLYFAYPGIWQLDDELADAVSATLDSRGDDSTGWSLAWKLALRARLRQPEIVDRLLALLFRTATGSEEAFAGGLYSNLFAAHPPFQIDGNLGYVAAIAECLMQSHRGSVELLPAVPSSLGSGTVSGLVARPGISVDIDWRQRNGAVWLKSATLTALTPMARGARSVKWDDRELSVTLADQPITLSASDFNNSTMLVPSGISSSTRLPR
jgi:alpha-L-fucosidase 2